MQTARETCTSVLHTFLTGNVFFVSVVEFRTEELMKKAVEKVNKHNLNGRPLKVKEVGPRGGSCPTHRQKLYLWIWPTHYFCSSL